MAAKKVRIGLVQSEVSGDLAGNLAKSVEKVRDAVSQGAKIVCLQELYRTRLLRGRIYHLRDSWVGLYRVPAGK